MRARERHHVRSAPWRAPSPWSRCSGPPLAPGHRGHPRGGHHRCRLGTGRDRRRSQRLPVLVVEHRRGRLGGCHLRLRHRLDPRLLGALAFPPFTAGLYRGIQGVALALSAEMSAVVIVSFVAIDGLSPNQGFGVFSWTMTGLGLGLIGMFLHSAPQRARGPARSLPLRPGPDPPADRPLRRPEQRPGPGGARRRDPQRGPRRAAGLGAGRPRPTGRHPHSMISKPSAPSEDLSDCEDIAVEAWAVGLPVLHDQVFAFPLNTDAGTVAIVAGILSDRVDPARLGRRGPDPQADAPPGAQRCPPRHGAAVRGLPRRGHRRGAPPARPGDARRRGPGHRLARLPRRRPQGRRRPRAGRAPARCCASGSPRRRGDPSLRADLAHQRRREREPRHRYRLHGPQPVRGLRRAHPRHPGRAHPAPAPRGRGRAVPDRPGGDEQRRAARPGLGDRRALPACTPLRPRSPSPTTVAGSQAPRPTSHGLQIMAERALLIDASLEIGETPHGGLSVIGPSSGEPPCRSRTGSSPTPCRNRGVTHRDPADSHRRRQLT